MLIGMVNGLKKIVKKYAPKNVLNILISGVNLLNLINSKYYRIKLRPLIIRKNTSDIEVFKQIFTQKDYEFDYGLTPKFIIDGGANVGYSSIFFARKFKNAKIIAIEPERSNFEVLKKNTAKYGNIIPLNKGLWPKKGYLKIYNQEYGKYACMTKEVKKDEGYDVEVVTIDDLLRMSNCKEIDVLKLDIEGAEKELFSKNTDKWLIKVNLIIIELHEGMKPGCNKAFFSAIKKYNFTKETRGENLILKKIKNGKESKS
jgi:FkbM family methyltransferase